VKVWNGLVGGLITVMACAPSTTWVLENVTVVNVEDGSLLENVAIVIDGSRIVEVVEAGAPHSGVVVDGRGAYVIPGLWDMHVHLDDATEQALPVLVANGVLAVRDMGGFLEPVDSMREHVATKATVGPQILRSGLVLDGDKGFDDRIVVETEEEGREAVRAQVARGVDHIKIHNQPGRDAYFGLVDEARKLGIPVVGHIPISVTPYEAASSGQATVEHIATIFEGTLMGSIRDPLQQLAFMQEWVGNGADSLGRAFAAGGAWFDPTLYAYILRGDREAMLGPPDARLAYVPRSLLDYWDATFPVQPIDTMERVIEFRRLGGELFSAVVGTFFEQGVGILAATDLAARGIIPGFSLHDELATLVAAGLPPSEALKAATLNPAIYLGATDSLGTVKAGRIADLVLLEANPIEDITNTTTIQGVVLRGEYLDRSVLDSILRSIADRAVG